MGIFLLAYIVFITLVFFVILLIDVAPILRPRREETYKPGYNPKVMVIVACKGVDLDLQRNLDSISNQDYKGYTAVGVVDNAADPAADYIRRAGMKLLVSGYNGGKASGKVAAILYAIKKTGNYGAYAIADSDIFVKRDWLRELVKPLGDKRIGISTMYPKFVPVAGFWSKVKYVWGFVGEGMMEHNVTRFGWGGSLAFRKDLTDRETMAMLSGSRYSVSDDICFTKRAREKGLGIAYVRGHHPVVRSDDGFLKFSEWVRRQTSLSVLGYRSNLYIGVPFYSAEILLFVSGIVLSIAVSPLFLVLLLHFLKSEIKTYGRARTPDPAIALITVFIPLISLITLLLASGTGYITWRGRKYQLGN